MLEFYEAERFRGCVREEDGDMLLFQWGTVASDDSAHFDLDIIRQLMPSEGAEDTDDLDNDDEGILQLSLTFRFTPTSELEALGSGDEWCASPSDLPAFRAFIDSSPAFTLVGSRVPTEVALDLDSV